MRTWSEAVTTARHWPRLHAALMGFRDARREAAGVDPETWMWLVVILLGIFCAGIFLINLFRGH